MQSPYRRARIALVSSASALAVLTTSPVLAQDAASVEDYDTNIIIVTAQRQAESLQDVPVAVSAFTSEMLESQQIENTLDLQQSLPSTTFTKGNFTTSNITIRGIGSAGVAASSDQGVGVHFNDMPMFVSRLFETEFYDMERIEVLRGPQGTLFGRNATGGVINLITARPKANFGASGEVQYGNYDTKQVKGMLNLPFGDIGGARFAGTYQNRDGFTNNLYTGNDIDGRNSFSLRGSVQLNPGDATTLNIVTQYFKEKSNRSRIQKQLCATDATAILGCRPDQLSNGVVNADATLASILTSREFFYIAGAGALAPFSLGSVYGSDGHVYSNAVNPAGVRTMALDFEPVYRAEELIVQAELEHDFDNFTVTLNGGYTDNSVLSQTDASFNVSNSLATNVGYQTLLGAAQAGNPTAQFFLSQPQFSGNQLCVSRPDELNAGAIAGRIYDCAGNTIDFDQSNNNYRQWSLEARVASDLDGPVNFLLGGLYLNAKGESNYYVMASQLDYASLMLGGGAGVLAAPFFNSDTILNKLETYGVFGELYYEPSDTLKLTAGLRYSNDKKTVHDRSALLSVRVPFGTQDANAAGIAPPRMISRSFDEITGRFVIDWKPEVAFTDDTLVYASFSRGTKPGGINPPFDAALFIAPETFAPEIINAVEIGTKNTFSDGALQLNLTGFYYDYKDLQVSRIVNRTSFEDNTDATIYGVELETIVRPTRGFTVNATASYLKTKIKDLQLVNTRDPSGGRDDVLIIKDLQQAANCAVIPTVQGSIPIAQTAAIVNAFNNGLSAAVGNPGMLQPAVPVPGTNTMGAFSVCSQLAGFLATSFPGAYQLNPTPSGGVLLPSGVEVDLSGNELLNSPKWKFSLGAQYQIELASGWLITPRADLHFTGEAYGSNFNLNVDRMKAYEIVNAQMTVTSPDDRFYLRGYVQNLFDTQATTGIYISDPAVGLFTNIFTVEPRTYGLAAGFRF